MTTDTITNWLAAPATLPEPAETTEALRNWPWFVPARMMEAAREHRRAPFSAESLTLIQLYASDWLPAYALLKDDAKAPLNALPDVTSSTPDKTQEEPEILPEDMPETPLAADLPHEATDAPAQRASAHHPEIAPPLIQPFYSEDYFRHQGIAVSGLVDSAVPAAQEHPKTLMVMMSFAEWLAHFKTKSEKELEEAQEKSALRSMWQQEKLAAVLDEGPEEIPEEVFEMAVTSITREDGLMSESLAEVLEKQEKWSAAADMYRRLALKYPAKSAYFATRAEAAKKRLL